MSLKELRKFVLDHKSGSENILKNVFGNSYNVSIKDVVIMESKQ